MFLTRISVNHPVFATMIMVAIMVFGIYSYQRLPIEQLPDVDFPVVAVVVSYPGASPEAVEVDIVEPLENAVNTIAGLDTIQSTAQSGQALVVMIFDLESSSSEKIQEVRDKIDPVRADLPEGAGDPQILRFDPSDLPLLSLAVSSSTLSARDLTALTENVIATRLSNINGVGSATVVGGVPRQLNIEIDPDRLAAFNISPSAVVQALQAANRDLAAGSITQNSIVQSIQVLGRLEDEQDFYDVTVGNQGGQPVTLRDVATIVDGTGEATSLAILNGQPALAIDVLKTQGANTVGVAEQIRTTVAQLVANELPEGVDIEVVVDNAEPVENSFHAVQNMLIEGAILAVVIVFLFLNSWRSTVITGLTLPISIIGTMIALNFLGFTLNMMTLLALSLAVGILIDDAIVVRENITRHLHMGKSHRQAAFDGTNEIGLAVMATTLSIVAVFLPVAFMDGIMGRFFLQFGVTVSVAVLISLFVAFTLDPMMSSVWYDPAANPNVKRGPIGRLINQFDRLFEWITDGYRGLIRLSLKFRKTVLFIALLSFVGSLFLFPRVGVEFLPVTDNGIFTVSVETPAGSTKEATAAKIRQAETVIRAYPEVERTYSTVAGGLASSGANSGTLTVTMVDKSQRAVTPEEFMPGIRRALEAIPGAIFQVSAASGLGGGSGAPVSVTLYGDSFSVLGRLSDQLQAELEKIDGLIDITSSLDEAQPVVGIQINRDLADNLGVSMNQIATTLSPLISGQEVANWTAPNGQVYDVVVRLPESMRNDVDAIGNLPIAQSGATGSAEMITLAQVAQVVESVGPATLNRQDLQRGVTIEAYLEGIELGSISPQLQAAVDSLDLPPGYRTSLGGDVEQIAETGAAVGSALLLAVIFIYLVLASQFGSFLQPIAIMGSLPLALIGVMVGLLVGGSTLNMFSAIGFIMLMGLVVKNAILLVDNANQHVKDGWNLYEALVEAGATRFRPIIMTTLAMIFGMLPLALNLHAGSGENAPMAHAVIGGLISSTALTLVVVPVLLTYIDSFSAFTRRFLPKAPDDGHHKPEVKPAE